MQHPSTCFPFEEPPGPLWQIEARKYDQSLHYRLPAHLVSDDGTLLRFRTYPGGRLEHVTRSWVRLMNYPSEMWFWRECWYNVYVIYDETGCLDHFYCNAALPPVIEGTTVSFVDLDLDVWIMPDGRLQVLDTDEFAAHSALYGYPPDVRQNAALAVLDVVLLWRHHQPPFPPAES